MKLLTIVRHGKSSWSNIELNDHERPLKNSGIKRTDKVVKYLRKLDFKPDLIISSSAVRAYQTAQIIAEGIEYPVSKIQKTDAIYHASVRNIYSEIYSVDNSIASLLITGHNPGFTDFVNEFLEPRIDNLPTTGSVCIEFDTTRWEDISNSQYEVKFVVFPRMLP